MSAPGDDNLPGMWEIADFTGGLDEVREASRGFPFSFSVPGEPVRKQRPRFGKGRTYTPAETVAAEQLTAMLARSTWAQKRIKGASLLQSPDARFEVIVTYYVTKDGKQDLDNLVKLTLDACNGVIWPDDKQVRKIIAEVCTVDSDPETRVIVVVR